VTIDPEALWSRIYMPAEEMRHPFLDLRLHVRARRAVQRNRGLHCFCLRPAARDLIERKSASGNSAEREASKPVEAVGDGRGIELACIGEELRVTRTLGIVDEQRGPFEMVPGLCPVACRVPGPRPVLIEELPERP